MHIRYLFGLINNYYVVYTIYQGKNIKETVKF